MRNPIPMGSAAAMGASTPAMQQVAAKAYGSRGGKKSARGRAKAKKNGKKRASARRSSARKPKFGSPAWRKKYMGKKRR